jgi:hypothetical protein
MKWNWLLGVEPPQDVWSFAASGSCVFNENLEVDRGAVSSAASPVGGLGHWVAWLGECAWSMGLMPSRPDPSVGYPKPRRLFKISRPGVSLYRPGALAISRNARRRFWAAGKVTHLVDE